MKRSMHVRPIALAALMLALAGSALSAQAQSRAAKAVAPAPPAPPAAPAAPAHPSDDSFGTSSSSSMWTISTSDGGRTITLKGKDGQVTADIDGKDVPADRIVRSGNTVRIKDEDGDVIFEQQVPGGDTSAHAYTYSGPATGRLFDGTRAWRGLSGLGTLNAAPAAGMVEADTTPPTVMVGVQMLEPDASLRGHLGLKEGEATMIGAIYEGLPAAQAGLEPYDIIVAIDGKSPASPEAIRKALRDREPGQGVKFDVIHQGQKKTVTITPETYDREKMDKAKVNAIAAASENSSGDPFQKQIADAVKNAGAGAWMQGGQPYVFTMPATPGAKAPRPTVLWGGGQNNPDMQDFAKRVQEMVAQSQRQAEKAQEEARRMHEQAERMHQQMMKQMQGGQPPGGMFGPAGAQDMNERMKKMEEAMQKLIEMQKKADEARKEGRS